MIFKFQKLDKVKIKWQDRNDVVSQIKKIKLES